MLYRAASAAEEGHRVAAITMPNSALGLFIPQMTEADTVRAYDASTAGNLLYERRYGSCQTH